MFCKPSISKWLQQAIKVPARICNCIKMLAFPRTLLKHDWSRLVPTCENRRVDLDCHCWGCRGKQAFARQLMAIELTIWSIYCPVASCRCSLYLLHSKCNFHDQGAQISPTILHISKNSELDVSSLQFLGWRHHLLFSIPWALGDKMHSNREYENQTVLVFDFDSGTLHFLLYSQHKRKHS